jgi:hypothetical protein
MEQLTTALRSRRPSEPGGTNSGNLISLMPPVRLESFSSPDICWEAITPAVLICSRKVPQPLSPVGRTTLYVRESCSAWVPLPEDPFALWPPRRAYPPGRLRRWAFFTVTVTWRNLSVPKQAAENSRPGRESRTSGAFKARRILIYSTTKVVP